MSIYYQAAVAVLGPLLADDRFAAIQVGDGEHLDLTAVTDADTLSSSEQVMLSYAQALYGGRAGADILGLGKLDAENRSRVLDAVNFYYRHVT